tara:strand:- start:1250 stop:1486 length:237 start_codon:yes stop_codon:yes gene_type:complete
MTFISSLMGGGGGAWGSITGTLSSQTDLQAALDTPEFYMTPTGDITIPALFSSFVSGYYEIADTKYLEISEFSTLEIG